MKEVVGLPTIRVHIIRAKTKRAYLTVPRCDYSNLDDIVREVYGDFGKREWHTSQGLLFGAKYYVGKMRGQEVGGKDEPFGESRIEKKATRIFFFGGLEHPHERRNKKCPACWSEYPVKCKNCGGLVHAQFGDEDYDGYYLEYQCDKCGEDYIEK